MKKKKKTVDQFTSIVAGAKEEMGQRINMVLYAIVTDKRRYGDVKSYVATR